MSDYITNPNEVSFPHYDVLIRKNSTGEIRLCHLQLEWHEGSEFWWTEGNMACDCNRYLEFYGALGERPSVNDPESKCGDSEYTAIEAIFPDGSKYKIDG